MRNPSQFDLQDEPASIVQRAGAGGSVPGCAVAIDRNGALTAAAAGVVRHGGDDTFTATTRVPLGCLGEIVLFLVGCALQRRDKFGWDEPLETYTTWAAGIPRRWGYSLTARHLLEHSSGLDFQPETFGAGDSRALIEGSGEPLFRPGEASSRSVGNARLLQSVLDTVEPTCVERFLETQLGVSVGSQQLFQHETTGHVVASRASNRLVEVVEPAVPLRSIERLSLTIVQIAKLGALFLAAHDGKLETAIRGRDVRDVLDGCRHETRVNERPRRRPPWYEFPDSCLGLTADYPGHNSLLFVCPESRISVAAIANSNSGALMKELLKNSRYTQLSTDASSLDDQEVADATWHDCFDSRLVCGAYRAHGDVVTVRQDGEQLRLWGRIQGRVPTIEHTGTLLVPYRSSRFIAWQEPRNEHRPMVIGFLCRRENTEVGSTFMRLETTLFRRLD